MALGQRADLGSSVTMVAFACTFGGALLGLFVHSRLPAPHLSSESTDVIKLVMGLLPHMTERPSRRLRSPIRRSTYGSR